MATRRTGGPVELARQLSRLRGCAALGSYGCCASGCSGLPVRGDMALDHRQVSRTGVEVNKMHLAVVVVVVDGK